MKQIIRPADATDIIKNSLLFWSTHWNEGANRNGDARPTFYASSDFGWTEGQKGEDRFDQLIGRIGFAVGTACVLRRWDDVEENLALLVSELRYRVFSTTEDSIHAGTNMVATLLLIVGFQIDKSNWGLFRQEFLTILQKHSDDIVGELVMCIRTWFKHPAMKKPSFPGTSP